LDGELLCMAIVLLGLMKVWQNLVNRRAFWRQEIALNLKESKDAAANERQSVPRNF